MTKLKVSYGDLSMLFLGFRLFISIMTFLLSTIALDKYMHSLFALLCALFLAFMVFEVSDNA